MKPQYCYGCKYLEWPVSAKPPNHFFCRLYVMPKITWPPVACEHYEAMPALATKPTEGAKE